MTQQPTPTPYASSRPILYLDGGAQPDLTANLLRMEVRQSIAAPATAVLTFLDTGSAGEVLLSLTGHGRRLAILAGDEASPVPLFAGTIDGLSYRYEPDEPPQLIVAAIDDLGRLDGPRRSRVFANQNDMQVISTLIGLHGLTADIQVATFYPGPETIVQGDQTDLAFLYERARRAQVFCRFVEDAVQVRQPATAPDGPTLTLAGGLTRATLSASLRDQPTETRVIGWDMTAAETVGEAATGAVLGSEADGLVTATDLLGSLGAVRPEVVSESVPVSAYEAQLLATTYFLESARRFVSGQGEARGDPAIHAGSHVTLAGLAPALNGRYFVPFALHRFDAERGYLTRFDVQRAGLSET